MKRATQLGSLLIACVAIGCSGSGGFADQGDLCSYDIDCLEHCFSGLQNQAPYCTGSCDKEGGSACPDGYYCVGGTQAGLVCAMGSCTSVDDCPQGYSCNADDGVCEHEPIECTSDDDCPAAIGCNQGFCVVRCESDDGCKQDFHCQYHIRCAQCVSNTHCTDGFACASGLCNQECFADSHCRSGYHCTDHSCAKIVGGGSGGIGDACTEHTDCIDFCYNSHCARACEGESDTTSCPSGYVCHAHHGICEPE